LASELSTAVTAGQRIKNNRGEEYHENNEGFACRTLFLLGAGALLIARNYPVGSATQMGPGYFPILVSSTITLIGFGIAVRSLFDQQSSSPVVGWGLAPMVIILLSVVVFAVAISWFGLIVAIVALVGISRLAGRYGSLLELVVLTAVLLAIVEGKLACLDCERQRRTVSNKQ
jgi:Tripartite tricarboxylate transporter TctB family